VQHLHGTAALLSVRATARSGQAVRARNTTVAHLAHSVVYEAREAVLTAVPAEVAFTGRIIGVKVLERAAFLKVEDPTKDGSIEVLAAKYAADDFDEFTQGKLVSVRGHCEVQGDPLGATMRLIVRASSVEVVAQLSASGKPSRREASADDEIWMTSGRSSSPSRPFPRRIKRLAVVTSPANAAIDDIRNALSKLGEKPELTFFECRVQGQGASKSIAQAIAQARASDADVLIVARGGDDGHHFKPAFDKPEVYAAVDVARQLKPTITGIGHARDTPDLVLNLYATHASATPGQAVHDAYALSRKVRWRQNALAAVVVAAIAGAGWFLIPADNAPRGVRTFHGAVGP
jgi:hypothetical protein